MIIRQTLNFTAHLLAGAAVGALAVLAWQAMNRNSETAMESDHWDRDTPGPEISAGTEAPHPEL